MGGVLHLPFDLVSLDLTRAVPSPFDRSSNGVATGASRDDAILAALHEYIERDAVAHWQEEPLLARMACTLDPDSVPFAWLGLWRDRIAAAGAALRFYRVPTLTGSPLFACEINDLDKEAHYYRAGQGRGCHPVPEIALFKALAEALQARLTVIAGGRDDLFPADYAPPADGAVRVAFGLPLPPSMEGLAWDEVAAGPDTPAALAEALARAGYPQVARARAGRAPRPQRDPRLRLRPGLDAAAAAGAGVMAAAPIPVFVGPSLPLRGGRTGRSNGSPRRRPGTCSPGSTGRRRGCA